MSRTPFDTFAKDLMVALLSPLGHAKEDARIVSDPQYADVYFRPSPGLGTITPRDGFVHLLASAGRSIFEVARQPPDLAEMASWQRKQLALWQSEQNTARRKKVPPPPLPPVLWGLSSGPPEQAMKGYKLAPMDATVWPRGCYDGTPEGTFRLVVLSELPRTRDTLLVRTMGRGVTFREAMEDLDALPPEAPERALARPFLVSLTLQLQNDPTDEAQEMLMQSQKLYEEYTQKVRAEGRKEGLKEGRKEGREEGLEKGLRDAIVAVCAARGLTLRAVHRAKLTAEADPAVLRRWLARAATATHAAEVFAADAG